MTLQVEATYENGVLKLDRPLPLKEHERIVVRIEARSSRVAESYGLVPSPDDAKAFKYLARSPENASWQAGSRRSRTYRPDKLLYPCSFPR